MEGQAAKRRRVYSIEPKKVVEEAVFTRNYMNYLVPALMKIKAGKRSSHCCEIQNVVKHEVDMAMVFSAQGFAWSNALKANLQRYQNEHTSSSGGSIIIRSNNNNNNNDIDEEFSSNNNNPSNSSSKSIKYVNRDIKGEEYEDGFINNNNNNSKLRCLRRLIPGGEDMCNEQMVEELESYISCLKMQVNVLQYLADKNC